MGEDENKMVPEPVWGLDWLVKTKKTRAAYAVLSFNWSLSFKVWSMRVTITTKTL
jgi:hypothetical protein